eukprot:1136703-Pelagomonas_calceolata.AAC.8
MAIRDVQEGGPCGHRARRWHFPVQQPLPAAHSVRMQAVKERKGEGHIAVPAYVGSLAEVKEVPVTKPVRSGEQKVETQSQHFKHADANFANPRTSAWIKQELELSAQAVKRYLPCALEMNHAFCTPAQIFWSVCTNKPNILHSSTHLLISLYHHLMEVMEMTTTTII